MKKNLAVVVVITQLHNKHFLHLSIFSFLRFVHTSSSAWNSTPFTMGEDNLIIGKLWWVCPTTSRFKTESIISESMNLFAEILLFRGSTWVLLPRRTSPCEPPISCGLKNWVVDRSSWMSMTKVDDHKLLWVTAWIACGHDSAFLIKHHRKTSSFSYQLLSQAHPHPTSDVNTQDARAL